MPLDELPQYQRQSGTTESVKPNNSLKNKKSAPRQCIKTRAKTWNPFYTVLFVYYNDYFQFILQYTVLLLATVFLMATALCCRGTQEPLYNIIFHIFFNEIAIKNLKFKIYYEIAFLQK